MFYKVAAVSHVASSRPPRTETAAAVLCGVTAVMVAAAGFFVPGSLLPPFGLLLGALVAVGLAYVALKLVRRPTLAVWLPPAAILSGALAGIIAGLASSVALPLVDLGLAELVLRCMAAAVALGVLAALTPFRVLARLFAGAALGAPGMLVLVWILAGATPQLAGGAQGLTVALLLVVYLVLLALWGAYLRRSAAVELVHEALGRTAVERVLGLGDESERARARSDRWLDRLARRPARARRSTGGEFGR